MGWNHPAHSGLGLPSNRLCTSSSRNPKSGPDLPTSQGDTHTETLSHLLFQSAYLHKLHTSIFIYLQIITVYCTSYQKHTTFCFKKKKKKEVPKESPKIDIKVAFCWECMKIFNFCTIIFLSSGSIVLEHLLLCDYYRLSFKIDLFSYYSYDIYKSNPFLWSNVESFSVKTK